MTLIKCSDERNGSEITDIFNDAILNTTSLYEYEPRARKFISSWFAIKKENNYPVIGIIDELDNLMGFATFGSFRPFPANKYTVEHSVYVQHSHRGKGLGRILLCEIVKAAYEHDYHTVIGGIDADNEASISLHKSMGFSHSGTIQQAGYKFGRWLDLAFYQKILSTPSSPSEI